MCPALNALGLRKAIFAGLGAFLSTMHNDESKIPQVLYQQIPLEAYCRQSSLTVLLSINDASVNAPIRL
jgi:hypothetical protein